MKFKTIHLLIIFAVLLAVVFVIKKTSVKKEEGSLRTEFFSINYDKISKFTIIPQFDKNKEFSIIKENDKWYVELGQNLKAETNTEFFDRSLKELKKLKPSRLASNEKEKWAEYGVDSLGTILEITDNQATHKIILGSLSFQNQQTVNAYVRMPDETKTYACESYMEGTFKSDKSQWRKRKVIEMPKTLWANIDFQSNKNLTFKLNKKENTWLLNNKTVDSIQITEFLTSLEKLNQQGFADNSTVILLPKANFSLVIQNNENTILTTLDFYKTKSSWIIASSINDGNYFAIDKETMYKLSEIINEFSLKTNNSLFVAIPE
ncbi:MAG: DUF4340 domain-containing protein [Bacteroidota bacterium]|nr:DUF4340 domain-containing protein [Bacteroidota bacterium]